jgi:hypothetical protein
VGQRDKLNQLASLPGSDVEKQDIERILQETSEYVKDLREQFDALFEAAASSTGLLDHLNPEQRELADKLKQTILWRRGFSDSYFLTVPYWYESSWGAHSLAIYISLFSVCALFIWALARKNPFRGAVEFGLATEISKEEVYGPVNVRVVELEKHAGYPRIVVGNGLLNHLNDLEQRCPDNLEGRHTKLCIQGCRRLMTTDHTDTLILDPMGEGMKSAAPASIREIIEDAYKFVVSQEQFFINSDKKLQRYYSELRRYCESKLALWNLCPIQ